MNHARYLVVGGHTRSIGKTALVVDLIRAFPGAEWTAVKITQYGHGVCSEHGEPCDCASATHPAILDEERDRSGRTDTSRFLVAGARRSFWLRTRQGDLAQGMGRTELLELLHVDDVDAPLVAVPEVVHYLFSLVADYHYDVDYAAIL